MLHTENSADIRKSIGIQEYHAGCGAWRCLRFCLFLYEDLTVDCLEQSYGNWNEQTSRKSLTLV